MHCTSCGNQIPADSAFCPNCGRAVENAGDDSFIEKTPKRHSHKGLAAVGIFIILCAAMFAFIVLGGHDLSGIYATSYDTYFYINSVSFDNDGTFTMQTLHGSFYGKYHKKKGVYYLYPDGGTSDRANPVADVEENHMASEYYFIAERTADNTLEITMLGRGDYGFYLPWSGQAALFYEITTEGINAHEERGNQTDNNSDHDPTKSTSMMDFYQEQLEEAPPNDIGRPPEKDLVPWDELYGDDIED